MHKEMHLVLQNIATYIEMWIGSKCGHSLWDGREVVGGNGTCALVN